VKRQTAAQHTDAADERSMHPARSTAHLARLAAHSAPSRAGAVRARAHAVQLNAARGPPWRARVRPVEAFGHRFQRESRARVAVSKLALMERSWRQAHRPVGDTAALPTSE